MQINNLNYLSQCILIILIWGTSGNTMNERIANLRYECSAQENSVENNFYPWITFIPLKTRTYNPGANVQCIGALISKRFVITTSTCLAFVVSEVFLGHTNDVCRLTDMVRVPVESWMAYDKANIALLKLAADVEFSDTIRPICLPFEQFEKPKDSQIFDVVSLTHAAESPLISKKIMRSTLAECKNKTSFFTCLRSTEKDVVCYGDQGSPITYFDGHNWVLDGILYEDHDGTSSLCVRNSPAVGLKITEDIVDWIVQKVDG